jgi:hypothetical protein
MRFDAFDGDSAVSEYHVRHPIYDMVTMVHQLIKWEPVACTL